MHHSNAVRRILPNGCVCVGWCVCVCRWVGGSVPNDSVSCSPSPFAGRCGVCTDVWLQELRAAQPRLKWGFPCVPDGMRVPIAMPMPLELRTDAGAAEKGILFAYHYGRCTCVCLCMFVCGCVWVCVEVWGRHFHAIKSRHSINQFDKYTNRSDWNFARVANVETWFRFQLFNSAITALENCIGYLMTFCDLCSTPLNG